MAFYYSPELGTYHLNEAKPPRVVPGHERHRWAEKITFGQQTTCVKCGCTKRIPRGYDPDIYQMPGSDETTERPACTGAKNKTDDGTSLF